MLATAKAFALVDAVLTPVGFGAKSSATFHRQLSLLIYGLGSCTFCAYSLGLNIDPTLSHSLLGRWRPILHVILLYAGSVSDIFVMGHSARNPEFGKFSYWSSDKYAKENQHILMESLSEGLVGWLFLVFLIWPIMCFGVTLAHISECPDPMLESSFNVLIVPGLALNWLWAALWLAASSMHFEYLQLCLKGLRDTLFERLRRGELSPEQLIAGNSAFSFLNKEWTYLVVASNPTSLLMLMSVFVAIYDWVFSPWSSAWLMVWAIFFAMPSAYSFNAFVVNLKEEEKMIAWIAEGKAGTEGWSLRDRSSVVVLLKSELPRHVKVFGNEVDQDYSSKYLFFIFSLSLFLYTFGEDTEWEGFSFDQFGNATND
ncbi:hypothetical protein TrVE_jg12899 [Triparma verrucosa]|uniref:Uncharacterized protein n=1 Tax=Triparma verrucosa TaxID=1606542 RepID=A0A9W7KTB0_9STRA|nr:hypothetical protein TrVE_jg12899 [Triparma verrucosa]